MDHFRGISLTRVMHNASAQLIVRFSSSATSFIAIFFVSFFLGYDKLGSLTKITTFVTLFYLPLDFGLNTVLLRDSYTEVENKLGALLSLRIVASLGLIIIILVITIFLPFNPLRNTGFSNFEKFGIFIFSLTLVTYGIYLSLQAPLQKHLKQHLSIFPSIISSIVLIGGILIGVSLNSLMIILASYVFSSAILATLLFYKIKNTYAFPTGLKVFSSNTKKLLIAASPLGIMLLANVIYSKSDIIILSILKSSTEVGIYGFSYKIFELLITLPTFISVSVYPLLIEKATSPSTFTSIVKKYLTILFALSIVLMICVYLMSPLLSVIKSQYILSVKPLQILSLALPFFFLTSLLQWLLILHKKMRFLITIYTVSLFLNIILNLLFIPKYSYTAAAYTTVFSECIVGIGIGAYLLFNYSKFIRT